MSLVPNLVSMSPIKCHVFEPIVARKKGWIRHVRVVSADNICNPVHSMHTVQGAAGKGEGLSCDNTPIDGNSPNGGQLTPNRGLNPTPKSKTLK